MYKAITRNPTREVSDFPDNLPTLPKGPDFTPIREVSQDRQASYASGQRVLTPRMKNEDMVKELAKLLDKQSWLLKGELKALAAIQQQHFTKISQQLFDIERKQTFKGITKDTFRQRLHSAQESIGSESRYGVASAAKEGIMKQTKSGTKESINVKESMNMKSTEMSVKESVRDAKTTESPQSRESPPTPALRSSMKNLHSPSLDPNQERGSVVINQSPETLGPPPVQRNSKASKNSNEVSNEGSASGSILQEKASVESQGSKTSPKVPALRTNSTFTKKTTSKSKSFGSSFSYGIGQMLSTASGKRNRMSIGTTNTADLRVESGTHMRESVRIKIKEAKSVGGSGLFDIGFKREQSKLIQDKMRWSAFSEAPLHHTSQCLVKSNWFEAFCALVIALNATMIGVETEHKAVTGNDHQEAKIMGVLINSWYAIELVVRMSAVGLREWATSKLDAQWNWFDLFLVIFWVVDLTIGSLAPDGLKGSLRALRLLRLLRILRIFRFVRAVREFRKMIYACSMSLSTLMWALLLLTFELYFFSLVFIEAVNNYKDDSDSNTNDRIVNQLEDSFGGIGKAYYSLFKSMSNGISWGLVMDPLFHLEPSWLYAGVFLVFLTFTLFGIMNVLTAVFVESAMTSTSRNRELLVSEKESMKKMYISHIKDIFKQIDDDQSGEISISEIEQIFADPDMGRLLEALEIEAYDARSMFKLLDMDDSGTVDIDEFCDGCLRLKGEAKSFDIACLMYEHQRLTHKVGALMVRHEVALGEIRGFFRTQTRINHSRMRKIHNEVEDLLKANTQQFDTIPMPVSPITGAPILADEQLEHCQLSFGSSISPGNSDAVGPNWARDKTTSRERLPALQEFDSALEGDLQSISDWVSRETDGNPLGGLAGSLLFGHPMPASRARGFNPVSQPAGGDHALYGISEALGESRTSSGSLFSQQFGRASDSSSQMTSHGAI